jgi:hypothetical protein
MSFVELVPPPLMGTQGLIKIKMTIIVFLRRATEHPKGNVLFRTRIDEEERDT